MHSNSTKNTTYKNKERQWEAEWPQRTQIYLWDILKRAWQTNIYIFGKDSDDIFLIWKGTQTELELYMKTINSLHKTIKFTYESSK